MCVSTQKRYLYNWQCDSVLAYWCVDTPGQSQSSKSVPDSQLLANQSAEQSFVREQSAKKETYSLERIREERGELFWFLDYCLVGCFLYIL